MNLFQITGHKIGLQIHFAPRFFTGQISDPPSMGNDRHSKSMTADSLNCQTDAVNHNRAFDGGGRARDRGIGTAAGRERAVGQRRVV